MFLRLLGIEIRKTLKHPALWIGLSALTLLLGFAMLIDHAQIARGFRPATGGLERDMIAGLAFFHWIGILAYAVTASVIAAFDYPDRSIQLWLMRGISRPQLLFARLTAILFFGWIVVCFAVIAILGIGSLSRMLFFGRMDASNLNLSALLPVALRVFCGSIPYLMLTVVFAVISRSPLFAAGATIVYGSVFEFLAMGLSDKFPTLIQYLPASLSQALQVHTIALDRTALLSDVGTMSEPRAFAMIALIFIFLSLVSFLIFSRQDLGG